MRNEEIGTDNGTAIIEPSDPVEANSPGWWRITYTAGPAGIAVGGSVRFEIPYGFTPPQIHWHGDEGHCQVECSREGTRVELSVEDPPVELDPPRFFYVTRWGRMVYAQVLDEPLVEGDTITLTYGRHPGFQPGAWARHFAGEAEFTVATDVDGTRSARFSGYTLVSGEQPTLEVIAAHPDHFEVCAPSLVLPGEPVEMAVLTRDGEQNTCEPVEGVIEITANDPGAEARFVGPRGLQRRLQVTFGSPGEKVVRVTDLESGLTGASNPTICTPEPPELSLFWGDIHGHTWLSDGLKQPEEYFQFAREEAALDFTATADHSQYMSDEDWEHIMAATREFNRPGEMVTLLGYECSLNAPMERYGDKNIYYPGDEGPLLRATDINRSAYADIAEHAPIWKEHGAMMILHQHAHGSGSFYDPDLVRLCEVYSIWGASESLDATRPLMPARDRDFSGHLAADLLAKGWILGFMAASDDHAGRPGKTDWLRTRRAYPGGLAAVWAPELTREAIWDALWNRRCYGTTGARIVLQFDVDGAPMGSILEGEHPEPRIDVAVTGTEAVTLVEVLRGRDVMYEHTGVGPSVRFSLTDTEAPAEGTYYYARVTQADGEMAWSSPVWVNGS